MKRAFDRRYYLHRRIKVNGFGLKLGTRLKTITVLPDQVTAAKEDKYVTELQNIYHYGVQVINPMTKYCEDEQQVC